MRRIRYAVAASLDAYIAGPNGEADWIIADPDIDFGELFSQFDTVLMGRRTFQRIANSGKGLIPGMETFVFSRALRQRDYPKITIVAGTPEETVTTLRSKPGKDIWLFGGGSLFRSLAEMQLVDTVEIALIPILLGGGIPLLPSPTNRIKLRLNAQKLYKTGIVSLEYAIIL
jgi:dihydrofolate reductase